jgi:hypothetical protein
VGPSWLPLLTQALSKAAAFKVGTAEAALSVALELSSDGALEHYRFCRSTIKADGLVDSKALQALAERKPKARTTPAALKAVKDVLPLLEQLVDLAGLLRQQRLAAGSNATAPVAAGLSCPPPRTWAMTFGEGADGLGTTSLEVLVSSAGEVSLRPQ